MAILRDRLRLPGRDAVTLATSAQLPRLPNGCAVAVAGLVIARQRPGTARGTMFLLFEDEWGTVNLIVSAAVYERHRHLARAEPLLLARGRLERSEGVINVIVRELAPLESYLEPGADVDGPAATSAHASVHALHPSVAPGGAADRDANEDASDDAGDDAAQVGSSMRAVAPPVTSFAMGRRR
jgi:error-prone DNA polymerase